MRQLYDDLFRRVKSVPARQKLETKFATRKHVLGSHLRNALTQRWSLIQLNRGIIKLCGYSKLKYSLPLIVLQTTTHIKDVCVSLKSVNINGVVYENQRNGFRRRDEKRANKK